MRSIAITALFLLAACGAPTQSAEAPAAAETAPSAVVNNCPASASFSWSGGPSQSFSIDASTTGASCAEAQATITIRDGAGAVAHTETIAVSSTQALSEAESPADMERRLREWITPAGASMDSTGDLAAWAEGAPEPSDAEVPFHPAARVTREIYQALRAADAPMYCYEQSREGGVCLTLWDGVLEPIGVQTYAN